jgi:protein-S-isoprenylcysteine O-methyltransferase Ste14
MAIAIFPVLVVMYVRLAKAEEHEAIAECGDAYRDYAAAVPGFIPKRGPERGATVGVWRLR